MRSAASASALAVSVSTILGLAIAGQPGHAAVGPLAVPDFFAAPAQAPPPLRLAESALAAPLAVLPAAASGAGDALAALYAHNTAGLLPLRTGFARPLPVPARVRLDHLASPVLPGPVAGGLLATSAAGDAVWGARLRVEGAFRLRLQLARVELPARTRLWVWGAGETPRAFGLELRGPDGDLWTPSVGGEEIYLEVEIPRAAAARAGGGFDVVAAVEILRLGRPTTAAALGDCIIDATCVTPAELGVVASYRKAVGYLEFFIPGIGEATCTGALLNDTDGGTLIPYLLTANHCISTAGEAASLETFFDYKTATCDGTDADPDLSGLPRENGSTLVATGEDSDFTLLRLPNLPAGRTLLGWDERPSAVINNTPLFRISHPFGEPQRFSASRVRTSGVPVCDPRPDFLYAAMTEGGTFGGSSGAPVILASGLVVGQLSGGCGPNGSDGCDYANSEVDGAFSETFPAVASFLDPATTPGDCTPGSTTLCLNGERFQVRATFETAAGATAAPRVAGTAQVVELTGDTGYLWFFAASNVEAVVKVLDGCGLNNHYWVFAGGLTDVRTVLTVTDTQTGATRQYTNPQGKAFQPIQDTSAFATCP